MQDGPSRAPVRKTTDDARQGETGHHLRYILAFGTIGAIVALGLVFAAFYR